MGDLNRELCECPKCGRSHWKLGDPPKGIRCPQCGEPATYQTPDGAYWDSNGHCWRPVTLKSTEAAAALAASAAREAVMRAALVEARPTVVRCNQRWPDAHFAVILRAVDRALATPSPGAEKLLAVVEAAREAAPTFIELRHAIAALDAAEGKTP